MVDAIAKVQQYDYSGKLVRDVTLPGLGSVGGFSGKKEDKTLYYTFTNYTGMDPEVSFGHDASWASGIDLGLYPLPRTVMFGFSVDF